MKIANIIPAARITLGRSQIFSYAYPADMDIKNGMVVEIPFGKKQVLGVVLSVEDRGKPAFELKSITKIIWAEAIFTPQLAKLAFFLSERYAVSTGLVVKAIITKTAPRAKQPPLPLAAPLSRAPLLTPDQQLAADAILQKADLAQQFLLYGVTGAGKTEVYLEVIGKIINLEKQALVLVPEIALTPQTLTRFSQRFDPAVIAVVHSKLSYGQKYLVWKGILSGKIKIVIGPRSAVFAPFKNLGVILMDEEHDPSYKQFDQKPKFHARVAAAKLSELWSCPLILGDATPSVESYQAAAEGQIEKHTLKDRFGQKLPIVRLVDMRDEAKAGNFTVFSQLLTNEIRLALTGGQQVILFLNRRGTATSFMCRDCGNLIMCGRCSVPVVYHAGIDKLVCHHCNQTYSLPGACPVCKSARLKLSGTGTEKVEFEIRKLFPQARILRLDHDTASKKNDLENIYKKFLAGDFDILVGTQMLAKGWDMARVGLIGVVNTDTILSFPDFRSNERTFQLITQVAGRAGRRETLGQVIFQTYTPDNFAIRAAVTHDYQKFFEREINERREYFYPPFSQLVKCTIKHTRQDKAVEEAELLSKNLKNLNLPHAQILGPSSAFIERVRGRWGVYVIMKLRTVNLTATLPRSLIQVLQKLTPAWDIDVDPDTLL